MTFTAKVAACSKILTNNSKQSEHSIEFFLSLVLRKGTTKL